MAVNIKEFLDLKAKALARILEVTPENIVVAFKQFDLEQAKSGVLVEKPEEVAVQSKKGLNDQLTQLQSQIDEIKAFLALT